jgi:formate hydrogenlyase subunit 6/NADH:ubiquinone oxidoreductase subunit I
MLAPQIDSALCNLCGRCIAECPTNAVQWVQGRPQILHARDCVYCGVCEDICPVGAVALVFEIVQAKDAFDRAEEP